MNKELAEVVDFIKELIEDGSVPRNVKSKFNEIIADLKKASDSELSLTINKLLSDLDEISADANLDQFTRQQIWSITSLLESIETE